MGPAAFPEGGFRSPQALKTNAHPSTRTAIRRMLNFIRFPFLREATMCASYIAAPCENRYLDREFDGQPSHLSIDYQYKSIA
jgi:hypothetical protein